MQWSLASCLQWVITFLSHLSQPLSSDLSDLEGAVGFTSPAKEIKDEEAEPAAESPEEQERNEVRRRRLQRLSSGETSTSWDSPFSFHSSNHHKRHYTSSPWKHCTKRSTRTVWVWSIDTELIREPRSLFCFVYWFSLQSTKYCKQSIEDYMNSILKIL